MLTQWRTLLNGVTDVIKAILLDMDDVLVDFIGGYCSLIGMSPEFVRRHWPEGEWSIIPALAAIRGEPMSVEDFWAPLEGDSAFWEKLDPLPWCDRLIGLCRQYTPNVWLASSPSHCDSSYTGKVRWIKRKFGRSFDKFHLTPHKEELAKEGYVLIDDRWPNVAKFIDAHPGAEGILFPQFYNAASPYATDDELRLDYVNRKLALLNRR